MGGWEFLANAHIMCQFVPFFFYGNCINLKGTKEPGIKRCTEVRNEINFLDVWVILLWFFIPFALGVSKPKVLAKSLHTFQQLVILCSYSTAIILSIWQKSGGIEYVKYLFNLIKLRWKEILKLAKLLAGKAASVLLNSELSSLSGKSPKTSWYLGKSTIKFDLQAANRCTIQGTHNSVWFALPFAQSSNNLTEHFAFFSLKIRCSETLIAWSWSSKVMKCFVGKGDSQELAEPTISLFEPGWDNFLGKISLAAPQYTLLSCPNISRPHK